MSEEEENNAQQKKRVASARALMKRAIPFLRDAGAEFEDDGQNEPLELAREIEAALEGCED